MKPNEIYFDRARGPWDWLVEFEITSDSTLWGSHLTWLTKCRISLFAMTQKIFGPFQLWTHVDFVKESQQVKHTTIMKKWGFIFYKSHKTISLASDGIGLKLEGAEFFWPLISRAVSFQPVVGSVDVSTSKASYQMPLAGTLCDCKTYLGPYEGYMEISTPWLRGRFTLQASSKEILASRF